MILIIKDNKVFATHTDDLCAQISLAIYPSADDMIIIQNGIAVEVGDDDPTLAHPEYLVQSSADIEEAKDWGTNLPIFATVTTDQAAAWVDANVSDLASAKTALKYLARAVILLRNRTI